MREGPIEAYLVSEAERQSWLVRKVGWIGRKDAPDRVLMKGVTLWVEAKATGEVPRPSQLREHERMRKAGQLVYVVDSFEAVDALLRKYS